MANALKTLFTEIADAIRETLTNEGKMSPNSFPDKIREVASAGGSSGELSDWGWVGAQGTYKPSTTESVGAVTVTHGLGVVPDFIIVYNNGTISSTDNYDIILTFGVSEYLYNQSGWQYAGRIIRKVAPASPNFGIDSDKANEESTYAFFGNIRNVTTETFTVGCDNYFLHTANTEYGFAVLGRKATE